MHLVFEIPAANLRTHAIFLLRTQFLRLISCLLQRRRSLATPHSTMAVLGTLFSGGLKTLIYLKSEFGSKVHKLINSKANCSKCFLTTS